MPRRSLPSLYPTASSALQQGYILDITPVDATSSHLLLTHPSPRISLVDAQTLQLVDVLGRSEEGGHASDVSTVCTGLEVDGLGGWKGEPGGVWSAGKDAVVIRWDERTRRPEQRIRAVRKPLPLLSIAYSQRDNLLAAGSELVGSDAYIVYWDVRRPSEPIYTHSQTHSDDITHLSFLPPTRTIHLPDLTSTAPLPPRLLLSASTDGLVALSDPRENDEDDACWAAEPLGGSVARAGWYARTGPGGKPSIRVWARSDMDSVGAWALHGGPEGAEVQLSGIGQWGTEHFRGVRLGEEGTTQKAYAGATGQEQGYTAQSDYVVDVCPSLGVSKAGVGMMALGDNSGNVTLMHHHAVSGGGDRAQQRLVTGGEGLERHEATTATASTDGSWRASAFLRTLAPGDGTGHRDVVRSMHYDIKTGALYTGSEDGSLCGWQLQVDEGGVLALRCGDPARDDDGGDGREEEGSDGGSGDDDMDESGSERSASDMSIG